MTDQEKLHTCKTNAYWIGKYWGIQSNNHQQWHVAAHSMLCPQGPQAIGFAPDGPTSPLWINMDLCLAIRMSNDVGTKPQSTTSSAYHLHNPSILVPSRQAAMWSDSRTTFVPACLCGKAGCPLVSLPWHGERCTTAAERSLSCQPLDRKNGTLNTSPFRAMTPDISWLLNP